MEMRTEKFFEEMKKIQKNLLDYIDYENSVEENLQNLIIIFDDIKIRDNRLKIISLLYLILKISNYHQRKPDFFIKIEQILQLFKNEMKKYFSNLELFHIFKSNKRLLLFLHEEQIMTIDEYIVKIIINNKKYIDAQYPQYFQPEFQPFINKKWFPKYDDKNPNLKFNSWVEDLKKELPEKFYENRKIGENDDEICKLIQNDSIEDFIIYINKNFYLTHSKINQSIFETNNIMLKNRNVTLIEYAVFFGSVQIFNYLRMNGAELKLSLWIYAVHSQNEEIIHFLEDNNFLPSNDAIVFFDEIYQESIKCHHIDVTNYVQNNYLQDEKDYSIHTLINCLKYYNFIFMQCNIDNETLFYYLCKYNHCSLVLNLLNKKDIDINKKIAI